MALDKNIGFWCKACYVFRVHREPSILLGRAPRTECGLPRFNETVFANTLPSHVTLVADALYTLKDSNIFHVSGSLFRMLHALYELSDNNVKATIIVPESWNHVRKHQSKLYILEFSQM